MATAYDRTFDGGGIVDMIRTAGQVRPAVRVFLSGGIASRTHISLEVNSQHELAVSRSKKRSADLAEVGVLNAGIWFVEHVAVEYVEKLSAELRLHPFRDREGLGQAHIFVVEGERTNVGSVARHIPKDVGNVNPGVWVRISDK